MKKFLFFALEILGIIGQKLGMFNYTPSYIVLPYFGD